MGKVIFTISYDIIPEKRDEYIALTQSMKSHFQNANGREYSVYEVKGKKNSFTELFIFKSLEEYNQLEDNDDSMSDLVSQLESFLNGKMKYTTLIEAD
ncbi:MAG: hypothetical protein HZB59_06270 [Ignavibacteriales bacterium]|nr:hypothetical protein [Ignavibacteriales bacterium]